MPDGGSVSLAIGLFVVYLVLTIVLLILVISMWWATRQHLYNRDLLVYGGLGLITGLISQPFITNTVVKVPTLLVWLSHLGTMAGACSLMMWIIIVAPKITPRRGP